MLSAGGPQVDDTTLDVTELPIRKWTQDYKEFLEGLIKPEEKAGPAILADYREHHSDADVHFSLQLLPGQMAPCLAAGLHAKFKLQSKISCGAQPPAPLHRLLSPAARPALRRAKLQSMISCVGGKLPCSTHGSRSPWPRPPRGCWLQGKRLSTPVWKPVHHVARQ